jgi:hypothetical protein
MREVILWIKYIPVILNLTLILGCLFALLYIDINHVNKLLSGSGLLVDFAWYRMSLKHKFCEWHRVLIYNMAAGAIFAFIDREFLGLIPVTYIRVLLLMSSFSIVTALILYFKYGCFKTVKHE